MRIVLFAVLMAVGVIGTVEAFGSGPLHNPVVAAATFLVIPVLMVVWLAYLLHQGRQRRAWREEASSERLQDRASQ